MQNNAIMVEGNFPTKANELHLSKYMAIGAFGNAEAEEAAVRLLMFSKEQGEYVAVAWSDVAQIWVDEFKEYHAINEAKTANYEAEDAHRRAVRSYNIKLILTLGIGYFFFSKPTAPQKIEVEEKLTKNLFSPTLMFGSGHPDQLLAGFWKLIDKGLVELKNEGETSFLYPTPALASVFC